MSQMREAVELQRKANEAQIRLNVLGLAIGSYGQDSATREDTEALLERAQEFFDYITADSPADEDE
jgi:septum formation inhibitor-activating ATPase MinD